MYGEILRCRPGEKVTVIRRDEIFVLNILSAGACTGRSLLTGKVIQGWLYYEKRKVLSARRVWSV